MKKGILVLIVSVFLLAFVLAGVGQEYQWHSSDIILIEINGHNITLQDAINNNYLGSVIPYSDSDYPFYSHLASEILIRTPNGYVMTLQEASDTDSFVEGVRDGTVNENTGHLASEISVYSKAGDTMTLQDLIDTGKAFCKTCEDLDATCGSYSDDCGGTISCGGCGDDEYCYDGTCSEIAWAVGDWSTVSSCGDTTRRDVACVSRELISAGGAVYCWTEPGDCGTSRVLFCPPVLVCAEPSTVFRNEVVSDSVCYDAIGTSSKPATSKATSCAWILGSYSHCAELGEVIEMEVDGRICSDMVGKSCTVGSSKKCEGSGSCDCGSLCTGSKAYNINCGVSYPAAGDYLDLEEIVNSRLLDGRIIT